jgi:septum formation protein
VNLPAIILASSSPRRRELLVAAGFEFEIVSPQVIEKFEAVLSPRELTLLNATRKGRSVARLYPDKVVVAADTLVALDGEPIGKPTDIAAAAKILGRLSGRVHEVYSSVFISHQASGRSKCFCEVSRVRFRHLTEENITEYLTKVDPLDKAGGYAAQGHGAEIIAEVTGSFSNVVGLPMRKTVQVLRDFGIKPAVETPGLGGRSRA